MPSLTEDLDLALWLADAADAISLARFGAADLAVDAKPDLTPVSDADLAVEKALREVLSRARPADLVVGEEFGSGDPGGTSRRRWVIDPIDGTKNFVRGVPVWATLIALCDGEQPVVGVVSAPALTRRWWAATGSGAFGRFADHPPRSLRVSSVSELADSSVSFSEMAEWQRHRQGQAFGRLLEAAWRTRAYGDFYSYMLVAEGAVDIAAEPELNLWDMAALVPIVREAGGSFTDVDGREFTWSSANALATNGRLHPAAVQILAD